MCYAPGKLRAFKQLTDSNRGIFPRGSKGVTDSVS